MKNLNKLAKHVMANINTSDMNVDRSLKLTAKEKQQIKTNVKTLQSPKLRKLNTFDKAIDTLCTDNINYDKKHETGNLNYPYDDKGRIIKNDVDVSDRTIDALDLQADFNDIVTHTIKYNPKALKGSISHFKADAHYNLGHDAIMGAPYMFTDSDKLSGDVSGIEDTMKNGFKNAKHYQDKYAMNQNTPALDKALNNKNHNVTFNQLFNTINHTHGCHAYLNYNKNEVNTNINWHQNTDYHGWPAFGGHGGAHKVLYTTIKMPHSYDVINMIKPNQVGLDRKDIQNIHNSSFSKASTNDTESDSTLENKIHTLAKRFAETPLKKRDFKAFPNQQVAKTMTADDRHRYNYMVKDLQAKHTKHQLQAKARHAIDNAFTATNEHNDRKLSQSMHTIRIYGLSNDSKWDYLPQFSNDADEFSIMMDNTKEDDWHQIAKNLNKYMKPYASKNSKDAQQLSKNLHNQKILSEAKKYVKQMNNAKKHLSQLKNEPILKHGFSHIVKANQPTTHKTHVRTNHITRNNKHKLAIKRNQDMQR